MPRLDYYDIQNEIKAILEADASLAGVTVAIEDEPFTLESCLFVGIHLTGRTAPDQLQRISAGQQTHYELRFSIRCWSYSMESIADALQKRDDLLGKVEVVLMGNRTINGKMAHIRLDGGDMAAGKEPPSYGSVGEIVLIGEATATTV